MAQKGKQAGVGAGMFGGAGASALLGLGALTAAAIAALDTGIALWLAALILALLWLAIAGVLAARGKKKVQQSTPPVPEQTQQSVKEDVRWAKTRARSARR
jgi:nitrate/nitrite transporter NarK